jgi:glucose/arabinose dehydrogenase
MMTLRRMILATLAAALLLPASASAAVLVPVAEPGAFESEPVNAASPPGDPRVFIVERGGGIRIVENGALLPTPFLTVPNVDTDVERGLLSIAFPPDYASSGLFYVFTVAAEADELEPDALPGQIRILEYHRSADPDIAEPDSARVVLATNHSAGNHNGGQIMFGPEGLLYVTMGDNATSANAQSINNYFGKILRIDPRDPPGEASFSVPESNPVFPEDLKTAIYSIGLRNPYRASFGPSGELIVGDVGNGTWEEVDVGHPTGTAAATTLAGANLGWPFCEGFCPSPPPKPGLTDPVFEYPHTGPSNETSGCAVLGGYVVRDPNLTGLTGRYLYGDLCRSDLRTLDLGVPGADPRPAGLALPSGSGDLRGFGEDSRGCLYVLTTETAYRVAQSADVGATCPLTRIGCLCPPPPAGTGAGRGLLGVGLSRKKHQRLRRYVTFSVTCSEACGLSANGALRIYEGPAPSAVCAAHDSRPGCPGDFQRASLPAGYAGTPVELHLKLKSGVFRRARAARRAGDRVKALLSVTATDQAGATTVRKFGIALR